MLFESIMQDTMVRHLEEKLLTGNSQHGFRKGRSCLSNLLSFLDKVTGSVDSGNSINVIFLDFAKAFDKVPHKRLTLKLESHGISGKVYVILVRGVEWCPSGISSGAHLISDLHQ